MKRIGSYCRIAAAVATGGSRAPVAIVMLLTMVCSIPTFAGEIRQAADIVVLSESVKTGDRRSFNEDPGNAIVLDEVIGGIGALVGTPDGFIVVKSSYVGQLYSLAAMEVGASSTTVNENASRDLTVMGRYDDESLGELVGQPSWTVLSGPIASISTTGMATADSVYQDAAASVQASYDAQFASLGLLVKDSNRDNYGLYSGDDVWDLWQVSNFGLDNPDALADMDPDGDQQNNRLEFMAGTSPDNPNSYFTLRIEKPAWTNRNVLSLNPTYGDRTYVVDSTVSLQPANWQPVTDTYVTNQGTKLVVIDLAATNTHKFYRANIDYEW